MSPLILFSGLVLILILIVFGVTLSSNINQTTELVLFWIMYVITIITVMTIFSSVYINLLLKNKRGVVGKKGLKGDKGDPGPDGKCEVNCRDQICTKALLEAVEERITELKNNRLTNDERDVRDYFRFLNSIRFRDDTGDIVVLKDDNTSLRKVKQIVNDPNKQEYDKEIKAKVKSFSDNKLKVLLKKIKPNTKSNFILNNMYIRQLIIRLCQSAEFKEVAPIKGPQYLIEYIKDILLQWIELIYKEGGELYFKTVGAENDFEWRRNNPFDEIKKYDLFYWGLPKSARPRIIPVKPKFGKKIEYDIADYIKEEGFTNLKPASSLFKKTSGSLDKNNNDLTEDEKDELVSDRPKNLKLLVSNDYDLSYNDTGTRIRTNLKVYRPRIKEYQNDTYFPLGDVAIQEKENPEEANYFFFCPWKDRANCSKSIGRTPGPQKSTVLVAGDVKPATYQPLWDDWQGKQRRHLGWPIGSNDKRYSKYRGRGFKIVCPEGYTSLGSAFGSQHNLDTVFNEGGTGYPRGQRYRHVCLPNECVEVNYRPYTNIWNTHNANRIGRNVYRYNRGDAFIYLKNLDGMPTHENSYNLFKFTNGGNYPTFYSINEKCISKQSNFNFNQGSNKDGFESFQDTGWPSILKLDKDGSKNEDKHTYYIDESQPFDIQNYQSDCSGNSLKEKIGCFIYKFEEEFFKFRQVEFKDPEIGKKEINQYISNKNLNKFLTDLKGIQLSIITLLNSQNEVSRLKNPDEVYVRPELLDLVGFLDSMPEGDRYQEFHNIKKEITIRIKESLTRQKICQNVENCKINELELGWKKPQRKLLNYYDEKNLFNIKNYSMHNFFFVPSTGELQSKSNSHLKFNFELFIPDKMKEENYNNLYVLKDVNKKYIKTDIRARTTTTIDITDLTSIELDEIKKYLYYIILTGESYNDKVNQEIRIIPFLGKEKGYFINVYYGRLSVCLDLLQCKSSSLFEIL